MRNRPPFGRDWQIRGLGLERHGQDFGGDGFVFPAAGDVDKCHAEHNHRRERWRG